LYLLSSLDPDYNELDRVKADFDNRMEDTPEKSVNHLVMKRLAEIAEALETKKEENGGTQRTPGSDKSES
jgi:hypothetical protein